MVDHSVQPSATVYLASFGALLGALSMGLALGYTAPAIPDMEKDRLSPTPSGIFDPDEAKFQNQKSLIGSMLGVGALVGGLLSEPSNKILGRRLSLIFVGVPFAVGWVFIAAANSLGLIVAGRLLTGLCTGLASGIAPTYVVEIAPPQIRGLLGTSFQVMVVIGILAEAVMGNFLVWRTLAGVSVIAAGAMILIMLFMPETPQWLLSKGRTEDAEESLKRFRTSAINQEFEAMSQAATQTQQSGGQYSFALISSREFYLPLILSLALMFFQQFSGINAVLFYQTDIFAKASPQSNATLNTIYVCLAQVAATVVGSMLVDRLGRRILLLVSGAGHTFSLLIFGLYSYLSAKDAQFQEHNAWLALVSLVLFVVSFSVGFGPIPWMMIPELSSMRVRSMVASISTTFNWICVTIITAYVKKLLDAVGDAWTYWIFAIICAISCAFVVIFLPETKGRTSDQIQRQLLGEPQDDHSVRIQEASVKSSAA